MARNYSNDEARLASIGANVSYSYIGAGTDRYSKTVNGTTTQFLYDGGNVVEELQGTTVTATYGAGAEKLNGVVSWMLQDGQGSTRQLLDSSQAVTVGYITDAYGNSAGGSGSSSNPYHWNAGSAYYSDGESGLQKVGARYYDPAVGRFISQDTMLVAGSPADSQALNRYNYCESNPVGGADPTGHSFFQELTGTIKGTFGKLTIVFAVASIVEAESPPGSILHGVAGTMSGVSMLMTGVALTAAAAAAVTLSPGLVVAGAISGCVLGGYGVYQMIVSWTKP